jgi:pyruvate-formate lyase
MPVLSERIDTIRSTILTLEEINKIIPTEHIAYDVEANSHKSLIIRHAEVVEKLFKSISINHIPHERIACNNTSNYSPRPNHLTKEELEEIRRYPERVSGEKLTAMDERIFYIWAFSQGHIVPDKELVLKKGMNGVIADIESRLQDKTLDKNGREFLEASLIECRGFLHYTARHAEWFREKAKKAENDREREYFEDLARLCEKVPANPATSFREALQSAWFVHVATQMDDVANHSLGRIDQYLFPYYKKDIDDGVLTKEEAKELFFELWLKLNLGYKLQELCGLKIGVRAEDPDSEEVIDKNSYDLFDTRDGFTWLTLKYINQENHTDNGQVLDCAGLDGEGNDATNEISWFILDAVDELRIFEPKPVIKYTDKTDKRFMRKAYEILASGFGLPAIAFDEAGERGLRSYNMFDEDAILNHCHIGCIELGIPGSSYIDPMNAFMNLPKIFLIALNNGYYDGKKVGLELKPPGTWDEFINNFYLQLDYFVKLYTDTMNDAAPFFARYYVRPLVSALIDGCIESAVPVDNGGARFWTKAVNCTGFATAVDSLFSIKKLVYDEKKIGLERLQEVLGKNYEAEEDFRLMVKNRVAKFGNGVEEVDCLANEVSSMYAEIVKKYRTTKGTSYRPGIYSFYEPIKNMGAVTGATPDGRKAGEVLSLNSAPYHGSVRNSLSEVLKSVTAIEHSKLDNASCLDVQLNGRIKPEVIEYIVEYLSKRDVLFAHFTVVDRDRLVEAQKNPKRYQDLTVRVTGFSARFVVLPKDTQDEIIERSYWG